MNAADPPAYDPYCLLITGDAMFKDFRITEGVLNHVRAEVEKVPAGGLVVYDGGVGGPAWCASKMAGWKGLCRLCYRPDGRRYSPWGEDKWYPHLHYPAPWELAIAMVRRVVEAWHDKWTVRGVVYESWERSALTVSVVEAWDQLLPPGCLSLVAVETTGECKEIV